MNPLVSVVIPCFNRSRELRAALESVLAQTVSDFEVVVADDASTEDLRTVVEGVADPRVRIVRRERNGGIGAARNTGVRAARGTYLSFLDSDDEWLPTMLETQLNALRGQTHPVVAVTTGFTMNYASGRQEVRQPDPGDDLLAHLVRGADLSAGSTMMIVADAWHEVGPWSEDIRRYEDYEWFLRFARRFHLVSVDAVTCKINADDRHGLDVAVSMRSTAAILQLHREWLQARNPTMYRQLRSMFKQEVAWAAWRSRKWPTFVRSVSAAVLLDPGYRVAVLRTAAAARVHWRVRPGEEISRTRPLQGLTTAR